MRMTRAAESALQYLRLQEFYGVLIFFLISFAASLLLAIPVKAAGQNEFAREFQLRKLQAADFKQIKKRQSEAETQRFRQISGYLKTRLLYEAKLEKAREDFIKKRKVTRSEALEARMEAEYNKKVAEYERKMNIAREEYVKRRARLAQALAQAQLIDPYEELYLPPGGISADPRAVKAKSGFD